MKRTAWFDVACNDPDNGMFAGRTHAVTYRLWDGSYCELEADNWGGYAFKDTGDAIRLNRKSFCFEGSRDWVGNWCWNGYALTRQEAKKFLRHLKATGRWHCTHGPTRWYDWFNSADGQEALKK